MRPVPRPIISSEGSASRALLWLLVGLAVLVGLIVVSAPELVWSDLGATTELLAIAAVAGIPGLALLLWVALRRRGQGDTEQDGLSTHHPEGHPDQREEG